MRVFYGVYLVLACLTLRAQTPLTDSAGCLKCHQHMAMAQDLAKRFVHPGDCTSCHVDHRPAKDAKAPFLTAAQPALCLGCHDAKAAKFAQVHQGQPVQNSTCTICHDPHASRLRGLLHEIQHGPFAGRHCDECHSEPENGKVRINGGDIKSLCLTCHVIIGNKLAASKSAHTKFVCTMCHTPHTSDFRPHLKTPRDVLCRSCHKNLPAGASFEH